MGSSLTCYMAMALNTGKKQIPTLQGAKTPNWLL